MLLTTIPTASRFIEKAVLSNYRSTYSHHNRGWNLTQMPCRVSRSSRCFSVDFMRSQRITSINYNESKVKEDFGREKNNYPIIGKKPESLIGRTQIVTETPFKNTSLIGRLKRSLGVGETNKFRLRRATIFHYEACTDKLDPTRYFEHFHLKDTLYSFFLVVQLHVWMCQVRSMSDGPEGRLLRNELIERMWQDMDVRLSKIEYYSSSKRKAVLEDLLFHHQGAMFSYDEGLLTDDKTLANALWRTLFSKETVDPRVLELAVKYVRTQLGYLRSISSRDWCLNGKFEWAPFPPLVVRKIT